jgi:hypothetical protein
MNVAIPLYFCLLLGYGIYIKHRNTQYIRQKIDKRDKK